VVLCCALILMPTTQFDNPKPSCSSAVAADETGSSIGGLLSQIQETRCIARHSVNAQRKRIVPGLAGLDLDPFQSIGDYRRTAGPELEFR
jgi:hypothetical protein